MSEEMTNSNNDLKEVLRDSKGKKKRALDTLYETLKNDESFSPENKDGAGELIDSLLDILFRGLAPEGLGDKMVEDVSKLHNRSISEIDRILNESLPKKDTGLPPPVTPETPGPTPASPLVLDLDGDGIETVGLASEIYFDFDGDGFKERSGFVGSDDGFLAFDKNGDGEINNGAELFGSSTTLLDGGVADNGFVALSDFDSNDDGLINSNDDRYSELRVFRDLNQNGITDSGELQTLSEAGVDSLSVIYTNQSFTDDQGNEHRQVGSYTAKNGSVLSMNDVWFDRNLTDTKEDIIDVPLKISLLTPNAKGFGNTQSLHQAMAKDTSGLLHSLVEQFIDAETREGGQVLLGACRT